MSKQARFSKQLRRREAKAARRRNRKARALAASAAAMTAAVAISGGSAFGTGGGGGGTTFPDEGLIAFDTNRDDPSLEVWTLDPDTETATNQTANPALVDRSPTWRRDGQRLGFTSFRPAGAEGVEQPFQVYEQILDDAPSANRITDQSALTDNNGGPTAPLFQPQVVRSQTSYSPDGTKIAFSKTPSPVNRVESNIYVVDVATGDETQITSEPGIDANPTWSPDGNYIAFESNRAGGDAFDIYRVSADTTNGDEDGLTNLTPGFAGDQVEPDYSPGSFLILYASSEDGQGAATQDIYVKPASANTTSWQLTATAEDDEVPRFSPRLIRFTYSSQRDGSTSYDVFTQYLLPDTHQDANVDNETPGTAQASDRRPDWQSVPGSENPCRKENEEEKEDSLVDEALATGSNPLDELVNNEQPAAQYGGYNEGSSDHAGGVSSDCDVDGGATSDGHSGGGSHSDHGSSD